MIKKNFFFKLMSNSVFRKPIKNVRKHRNIKLIATEKLFAIRTELSYYKAFYRKVPGYRTKINTNIYE